MSLAALVLAIFILLLSAIEFSSTAPTPHSFGPVVLEYSAFQISDGHGGDADVRASAVFRDPLEGVDLGGLPYDTYDAIATMREAAEDADVESFGPVLEQYGTYSPIGRAIVVGRTKNKVLMNTAEVQMKEIKVAKDKKLGLDTSWIETDLLAARKQLADSVQADKANAGLISKGVRWPVQDGGHQ